MRWARVPLEMALVPFLRIVPSPGEVEACTGVAELSQDKLALGSQGISVMNHLRGPKNRFCSSSLSPLWHKRRPEARKWFGPLDTHVREC